jgi:malate synthase
MQEKYININKLKVSESLSRFVKDELLKDTNISSDDFWLGFEKTIEDLEPKNRQLINFRETLQKKIDAWHIKNKSNEFNLIEYKKFLVEIGYLK